MKSNKVKVENMVETEKKVATLKHVHNFYNRFFESIDACVYFKRRRIYVCIPVKIKLAHNRTYEWAVDNCEDVEDYFDLKQMCEVLKRCVQPNMALDKMAVEMQSGRDNYPSYEVVKELTYALNRFFDDMLYTVLALEHSIRDWTGFEELAARYTLDDIEEGVYFPF